MTSLDQIMPALALLALLMYLAPRVIGGKIGASLPLVGAAILTVGVLLALVQTWFWYAR
jgi:hypothetical protein